MDPNVKVCPHCGEETLIPYSVVPEQNYFVEHWVCTKCYNRKEFYYNRETKKYDDKK